MEKDYNIYTNDDYAGASNGRHIFYYGYEATFCPQHGKDATHCCDKNEWCFTGEVDGREFVRLTQSEIEELATPPRGIPQDYLMIGIMKVLKDFSSLEDNQ